MACFVFLNHISRPTEGGFGSIILFFKDVRMGKGEVFLHLTYRTEQEKFVLS